MHVKMIGENSNNFFAKNTQFFIEFADISKKEALKDVYKNTA